MPNSINFPDTNNSSSGSIDAINEKKTPNTVQDKTISKVDSLSPTDLEILKYRYASLNFSLDSMLKHLEKSIIGQHESIKKLLFLVYNNQYLNMLEELAKN